MLAMLAYRAYGLLPYAIPHKLSALHIHAYLSAAEDQTIVDDCFRV